MKKMLLKSFTLLSVSMFFFSCGREDLDDLHAETMSSTIITADLSYSESDLYGTWDLTAMEVDVPVDLDGNGIKNTNLLVETDCFNAMSITFTEVDGVRQFSSINARMDFRAGETNDQFACMQTTGGPDSGTWDINEEGDLVLYMTINGTDYTHTKTLNYNGNTFSLDVTKAESMGYITGDPTGTAVENVTVVSVEYTR